jgi:pimeloyl-ACP methyl ester carboxylesterase
MSDEVLFPLCSRRGPPILFFPGIDGGATSWRRITSFLSEYSGAVVKYASFPNGASSKRMGELLAAHVLEISDGTVPTLVGSCFGSIIALETATAWLDLTGQVLILELLDPEITLGTSVPKKDQDWLSTRLAADVLLSVCSEQGSSLSPAEFYLTPTEGWIQVLTRDWPRVKNSPALLEWLNELHRSVLRNARLLVSSVVEAYGGPTVIIESQNHSSQQIVGVLDCAKVRRLVFSGNHDDFESEEHSEEVARLIKIGIDGWDD